MGEPLTPNLASPQTPPTLPTGAPQTNVDVLATVLLNTPDVYADLQRPVIASGTIVQMLDAVLDIRTAAGPVQISLPEIVGAQQTAQLTSLLESGKPVQFVIDAGSPPQTLRLMLPNVQLTPQQTQQTAPSAFITQDVQALVKGQTLSLTPLPEKIDDSFLVKEARQDGVKTALPTKSESAWPTLLGSVQTKAEGLKETLSASIKSFLQPQTSDQKGRVQTPASTAPTQPTETQTPAALHHKELLAAKISDLVQPSKPWPNLIPEQSIKAIVTGRTLGGHVVLQTGTTNLLVKETGALPVGTKVLLQPLVESSQADSYALPIPDEIEWNSMRQVMTTLAQVDPDLQNLFVKTRLPSPAQNLSGTALFLLSALQKGSIEEWLGPAVQTTMIKAGHKDKLDKAVGEIADILRSVSTDPRVGEWKAYPLPLQYGPALEMLRLYVHQDGQGQKEYAPVGNPAKQIRFVVSIAMNNLGPMQLDGLSRPKQLDIIIRSEYPLPTGLPEEMRAHYLKTLEALGLTGSLAFQTGRQNWMVFETEGDEGTDRSI